MATGPDPAGTRFFCTAGRGLEPFVLREVRARLRAKQVEYVSGKVFFTTSSDLNTLKRLKSAERLFLLVKRQHPLPAFPRHKEKTFRELQRLVHDAPELWLEALSTWECLLAHEVKERTLSPRTTAPQGKRAGDSELFIAKKLRTEHTLEEPESLQSGQLGKETEEEAVPGLVSQDPLPGIQGEAATAAGTKDPSSLTFRVSCRCSGAIAKAFTTQEVSRLVGVALMKQFGWRADLRRPRLEVFLHLSDVYSVVGIPVLRVPLASRAYIQTAGLRSTVAWAMASLAEIQAGAFVLDPMCGLGTILLEAAQEWPNACYVGADISDAQLVGAGDNLTAAGFWDRVELLKASVTELPLLSESVDVIISDVPFGKKFKLGKDIRSILGEMERVLRVGGTLVLLLSEAHCQQLVGRKGDLNPPGDTSHEEETVVPGDMGRTDVAPPWGSLMPKEAHWVSLGRTVALLCKYRKSLPSGGTPTSTSLLATEGGIEGPHTHTSLPECRPTETPADPRPG